MSSPRLRWRIRDLDVLEIVLPNGSNRIHVDAYGEDGDRRADDGILNEVWFTGSNESRRLSVRAVVVGRISESGRHLEEA